ncbi:Teosinte branched 1 cycloidea and PCF transcription factor 4 [Forsythia ovata]|uniref:Teosinte branched 1 cycloidea and PCF transcription factor 4 n=1 Tax=Forsythia ovata TaxID=205694 RepID=A0ABD1WIM9_9LAMI
MAVVTHGRGILVLNGGRTLLFHDDLYASYVRRNLLSIVEFIKVELDPSSSSQSDSHKAAAEVISAEIKKLEKAIHRIVMDPSAIAIATADHSQQQKHHPAVFPIYPSSLPGIGFASGVGGFFGFHIPARIRGDEEEHDGYSDKPSSASSDSRH